MSASAESIANAGGWAIAWRRGRSPAHLVSWELRTRWLLLTLAIATIPLLVLENVIDRETSPTAHSVVFWIDVAIWAAFAVDLVVRVWLAERRFQFLRENWFDVVIVLVPYLRALRLVMFALRARKMFLQRGASSSVLLVLTILFGGTEAIMRVQQSGEVAGGIGEFDNWFDGFWWTLNTMVTGDGVQDEHSAMVNIVGAIVTLLGLALLGMVTATIAAWFVEQGQDEEQEQILAELKTLQDEVKSLREELARQDRAAD
ncbi:MAG: ion transporter [Chloroflexi bacterium]|nr:ion transporter [Chloroflexota bacterium]MYF81427.1 ion transporter [Chloroflexota bacterium]